jgi:glycosyltransferase involved in cell wall biosynthesis
MVTVAVPTYRREQVLLDTLGYLLEQVPPPAEILVLDQTERHEPDTSARLELLAAQGRITRIELAEPSIPKAMNEALLRAKNDIVIFLDDDIRPEPGLIAAHASAHQSIPGNLVAGRVLQPWDEGIDFSDATLFHFACQKTAWISEFMGGNFSVSRARALDLGGFDENFVRVAYKFEAEFANRWLAGGRRILFEPRAGIHHLKASAGGTRTYGEHLTTWRPDHAVGAYYFAFRTSALRALVVRPFGAIATRYHLRHPWRIPITLFAELSAMFWAFSLFLKGPRHVDARSRNRRT